MKMTAYSLVGLTLLGFAVVVACAQQSANQKPRSKTALSPTMYRSPSTFLKLPGEVKVDLRRRGCRIPQQGDVHEKTNVIRGNFAKAGQMDWAVLCSVHHVSGILVYWDGSEQDPAEIARFEDSNYVDSDAVGGVHFQRKIEPVGERIIMKHYRAYGGPTPPPIDHQGIDDAFIGKASVTWYFHGGKWTKLTGAD